MGADSDVSGDLVTEAVPVRIVRDVEEGAPEFGSWTTFAFVGTEQRVRIAPQTTKRHRLVITCQPGTAGVVVGFIRVGSLRQVENGQGGRMYPGNQITVEAQPEVWAVPDGVNSLTLTILDERYT